MLLAGESKPLPKDDLFGSLRRGPSGSQKNSKTIQMYRYTAISGYTPGEGQSLLGSQTTLWLQGELNVYQYHSGENGLIFYNVVSDSRSAGFQRALQERANQILMGPFPSGVRIPD